MTSGLLVTVIKKRTRRRMSSDWPSPGPTAIDVWRSDQRSSTGCAASNWIIPSSSQGRG